MNWYLAVLKQYAEFSGRASRPEFWMFFLFHFIILIVLMILSQRMSFFAIIYLIYALGTLIPYIAVCIRRLHDTDKSGWFLLIGLIPLVGGIILLVLLALPGTSDSNRFGGPPAAQPPA
ncbi:MAG: DUF805 domain-containing protein [Wenzhouxiangella sp.]|nr:MAG: DUF805 domain-containing protein [Wenzhouxiangella sp.]